MKTSLSSRRRDSIKRFGSFFIAVTLITGMVGCGRPEQIPMLVIDDWHTMGLKFDGIVVAADWNEYGQCNIGDRMLN